MGGSDGLGSIDFSQDGPSTIIHGNYVFGGVDGVGSLASTNNSETIMSANEFHSLTGDGITVRNAFGQVLTGVMIEANKFYSCGISVRATAKDMHPARVTIRGNIFFEGGVVARTLLDAVIADNVFQSTGASRTFVTLGGSSAGNVVNVKVADNLFDGGATAIKLSENETNVSVSGNILNGQSTNGIYVAASTLTDITLHHNLIVTTAAVSSAHYVGITVDGGADASSNTIDIDAGGNSAMRVAASGTSVIVTSNRIRRGQSSGNTLQIAAGAAGTLVKDNHLDAALSDAGTGTIKTGNTYTVAAAICGKATLAAGTVIVSTTEIRSRDAVLLANIQAGGAVGVLSVGNIISGTSFVINSSSNTDTSTIYWKIDH